MQVGDVVKLKSGGPLMVIAKMDRCTVALGSGHPAATCVWNEGEPGRIEVPIECLIPVSFPYSPILPIDVWVPVFCVESSWIEFLK